ncbi:hypothetical protein VTN00DRAFT_6110 [Thermoascus crustaceus]|uniref:uncharacterized protein n=1 Tax=Thermoascus crustaceus TaxID=5088 RepID=UPI003742C6E1
MSNINLPTLALSRPRPAFTKCAWNPSYKCSSTALIQTTRFDSSSSSSSATPEKHEHQLNNAEQSLLSPSYWTSRETWKRAAVNTTRCLIGCTSGDFSSMWLLQRYTALGMGTIMPISITSGLLTSLLLETTLLHFGSKDQLPWPLAAKTAMGMSVVSMATMEAVQNLVDYHLTGGVVAVEDPRFWVAAGVSMVAGWMAPMPYNYVRLRRYARGCH